MELSFKELQKRDVINIVDGRSLGKIKDLRLSFPKGELTGIVVPGRNTNWFLRIFERTQIFISEQNIIKIGGDVILVNINCGDNCSPNSTTNKAVISPPKTPPKRPPNCPPTNCNSNCPPPYQQFQPFPSPQDLYSGGEPSNFSNNIDGDDY